MLPVLTSGLHNSSAIHQHTSSVSLGSHQKNDDGHLIIDAEQHRLAKTFFAISMYFAWGALLWSWRHCARLASSFFFFEDEIIGILMHPHRQEYPEDVYWLLLQGIRERFWDLRHKFFVVVTQDE
jgi:hypothetical protein